MYQKSATQGNGQAIINLGRLYESGNGVSKNKIVAYALYSLSVTSADNESSNSVAGSILSIEATLKPKEIEAAKKLITELQAPNNFSNALDAYLKKVKVK